MSNIKDINSTNFDKEVLNSELPVLIDFWAPWCGPCRMVGPVVENLAEANQGKIRVAKINVDENQALAMQYGIRSILQ
jgi:thioredoxin 1